MTTRARIEWPAQAPPDDFADRVVRAALADRAAVAQDELAALGTGDLPSRTSVRRARGWRRALGWLVAAAFGATLVLGAVVLNESKQADRKQAAQAAAVIAAKEEEAKALQEQIDQAQGKINAIMDQLATATSDAQRAELKRKIEEEKMRQASLRAHPSASAAPAAAGAAKHTCKCAPGDPLCSCL
jgi:hypothetical protein